MPAVPESPDRVPFDGSFRLAGAPTAPPDDTAGKSGTIRAAMAQLHRAPATLLLAGLLGALGCQQFQPRPLETVTFQHRIESRQRNGLEVSTAVLSRSEAKQAFGVDLYALQIQPVWLRLRNRTDDPYWLMLNGLDPSYYSAHEAAYKSHYALRPATNRRIDAHFDRLGIIPALPPRGETSGFAFTNVKLGTKEVRVRLLTEGHVEDFFFYVPVPGFRADYEHVDWQSLRESFETVDLHTDAELFEALQGLPCCTTRQDGSGHGDPLNLVIISTGEGLSSFTRAGWDETELLTFGSAWRTFRAFFGGEYRYSPMSALYFDGRPQDMGLQKTRDNIHERNHLRLWATGWRYRGDIVWIGTITRDIGVYFTTRAWNLMTHAIDPDVDEARHYLLEDLLMTEAVRSVALIDGVGAAERSEPHRNLMLAPFWTDGRRAVIQLGQVGEEIPISQIESFGDYRMGESIRALQGMRLEGGTIAGPAEDRDGTGSPAESDDASPEGESAPPQADRPRTSVYVCGDLEFVIQDAREGSHLWLPLRFGRPYLFLPRVSSDSGLERAGDGVVVWTRGEQAGLEVDGEVHADCVRDARRSIWEDAKLRGVDFRAVGNEPGWSLEIDPERIRLVADYGARELSLPRPEPEVDAEGRRTTYRAQSRSTSLVVVLEGSGCTDTMSGERFETRVRVVLDGQTYQGCGRPLH